MNFSEELRRPVILTCMHGRHDLTRLWIEHTSALGVQIYAAVTAGDVPNIENCSAFGAKFVEVPNDPLGAKHNAMLSLALGDAWDAAFMVPSDDFLDPRWIGDAMRTGAPYAMPWRCGIFDAPTGRAMTLTCKDHGARKYGAGRMIARKAIDRVGVLWTDHKMRGLDSDSHARLSGAGFGMRIVVADYLPVTDIKGEGNLWSYDTWAQGRGAAKATADDVLAMLSADHRGSMLIHPRRAPSTRVG